MLNGRNDTETALIVGNVTIFRLFFDGFNNYGDIAVLLLIILRLWAK